ncbi:alpha/beta fold hydrolase [Janibacter alittae]|uniref:Alpha/beta hydrolase n=1 Tax=Janibacter alittae TaxID=3115209 RepID=A0ABZ2MJ33_9MICO
MPTTQRTEAAVASADGTRISYDVQGRGPTVILISQALADRKDHRRLAAALAPAHTVINYDRRGRGSSTDTTPWSIDCEVEDIRALIDAHGPRASLIGASAGAVLALEAASGLGERIERVVAYEAPVIVDAARPAVPREFAGHLGDLVREGRNSQAVAEFFRGALGISAIGARMTRLMIPLWRSMTAMAQTTEYDLTMCHGLQDGKPLPAGRWDGVRADVLVLVGERSAPFMHSGSLAIAEHLNAKCTVVPRAHHATLTMQPRTALPLIEEFLAHNP